MKCLHICNALILSKVHENLYKQLDQLGIDQTIYYSVRPNQEEKIARYKENSTLPIVESLPMKRIHRLLFRNKITHLYSSLIAKVDIQQYQVMHATTLFSDGALALKLYKAYNIPYIVSVRGADVNSFSKYRKDLYPLAKEIIGNASRIIFISKSLENTFFKLSFAKSNALELRKKSMVINNGLDTYWLNNITPKKDQPPTELLYIGDFSKNKNVVRLIQAFLEISAQKSNFHMNIVGKGGGHETKILNLVESNNSKITYHGVIYDKAKLKEIYVQSHIFAMPSISETFGLVYVEALSQGLPIVCSKNQGVDNTFGPLVGEFVDSKSTASIRSGIERIIDNYPAYAVDTIDFSKFEWRHIAQRYQSIYQEIVVGHTFNI